METDIEACFDRLPHCLILDEVRRRIGDKRVLALVRLFLKADLMAETGRLKRTVTGTPQGGIALDSTELESYGQPGARRWITVYANSAHAWIVVGGGERGS